jgi:hypothetical protein
MDEICPFSLGEAFLWWQGIVVTGVISFYFGYNYFLILNIIFLAQVKKRVHSSPQGFIIITTIIYIYIII